LRSLVRENLGLKLFSFACAFVIYAFVHTTQDAQRTFTVDLVVLLPPQNARRVLVSELPASVRVTLRGPQSLVDGLRPEELGNFEVDLRSGRSGRISLEAGMLHVPAGLSVNLVDPAFVEIAWDDVVERDIPIQVTVTGEPLDGLTVKGNPEVNPRAAHARGARHLLDTLQFVRAEPFDVSGLAEGVHPRTIALDRSNGRIALDSASTTVTVEIVRKLSERAFTKLTIVVVGSGRATVYPPKVDVRVVGPPDLVKTLRAEQIVPRVDLKAVGANLAVPSSLALPVSLELEGCTATVTPSTVVVKW
jgi:YbbR domain-containing protein